MLCDLKQLLGLQVISAARNLDIPSSPALPSSIGNPPKVFPSSSDTLAFRRERVYEPKSNRTWSSDVIFRNIRKPWRSQMDQSHVHFSYPSNRSRKSVSKRFGRFSDFIGSDENWAQLADESAPPFFSPLSGLNFPIFSPLMGDTQPGSRQRGHHQPPHSHPPYSSLDYDRPASASEGRSRSPSPGYYDVPPPSQKGSRNPMMAAPPPPPPPPPPLVGGRGGNPGYNDRRGRPEKNSNGPYLQTGGGRTRGRGRGKNNDYGPPESYYPEYDDGVPHYSYNPAETPRCAKEVNVSYCIEDPEYPM